MATYRQIGVLLLVAGLAAPAPVQSAEQREAPLAGVTAIRLTASQTTPDASTCGIDLRALLPALSGRLSAGGLVVDPGSPITVTLSVMTGHDKVTAVCATTPMLGVYRRVSYYDEAVGWLRSGHAVLWQRGTATVTSVADHPSAADAVLSVLADALLESWRSDNAAGSGSGKLVTR